jgi:type II secretory pathway pseudopilin PulG
MTRRRSSGGFTLVEVAVAVFMAGIALTATAGAVTSGARLSRSSTEIRAGSRSSGSLIEEIRAAKYADAFTTYNNTTYPLSALGLGGSDGTCVVRLYPIDTGSTKWTAQWVDITATWKGANGTRQERFVSLITDRAEGSTLDTSKIIIPAN